MSYELPVIPILDAVPDQGPVADQTRAGVGFVFGVLDATAVPGPVIVALLAELGLGAPAVRQQLARMLRQEDLERERVGRVSVYRMTGGYLERWRRLRDGDEPPVWTGAYEVVVHDIPERRRQRRELLLAAATRAGYAAARPGLLIGLRSSDFAQQFRTEEDLVEVGRLELEPAAARRLADSAWRLAERGGELDRAATALRALLESSSPDSATGFDAVHRLWTGLGIVGAARFAAPALPVELLPTTWPADGLQQLFTELVARCREPAGSYLFELLSATSSAHLIRGGWWPDVSSRRAGR